MIQTPSSHQALIQKRREVWFVLEERQIEESEPLSLKETKNNIDEKIDDQNYDGFNPEIAKNFAWMGCLSIHI